MNNFVRTFSLISLLLLAISCGNDDNDNSEGIEQDMDMEMTSSRFEAQFTTAMEMETLLDNETNLVWINDVTGCFAGIVNPTTQCDELTFGGRSDWRIPTAQEMSELITAVDGAGMMLNYINSSCALMSTSDAVWVFTENSNSPGTMTMMEPGNAGLRCVTEK